MAIAAGLTLLAAGLVGAFATSLAMLIVALTLLGLGWNFGLISGTAMLVDATTPATRARTQGTVDVLVALSGAVGSALAGLLVADVGFEYLAVGGGVFSLVFIPLLIWHRRGEPADHA
jgi:MFS family permease